MITRAFDNFKTAIADPNYFFGRSDFLKTISNGPFKVHILLGGRRIGKTSALRAVEWSFLNPEFNGSHRAFPVLVNLQIEQPKNPDNFRYILIASLREAIERWKHTKLSKFRETYLHYLRQIINGQISLGPFLKLNINNPDQERCLNHDDFRYILMKSINELINELHFNGVCFLLDEAEFIVKQEWGDDCCSYIRGIKDTDTALCSLLGFIFSGYRDLKNYTQKTGSPFSNIGTFHWLCSLNEAEAHELIAYRASEENVPLNRNETKAIIQLSGCHAFILQNLLNTVFDNYHQKKLISLETFTEDFLWQYDSIFSNWWNADGNSDGFGEEERIVYRVIIKKQSESYQNLIKTTGLTPNKLRSAIKVLTGTGILKQLENKHCEANSLLFETWVKQECTLHQV